MYSFDVAVTREQLEADRARLLAEQKLKLEGDVGSVAHSTIFGDVIVAYTFREPQKVLNISIIRKPMIESNHIIEAHIREWFNVKKETKNEKISATSGARKL